MCYITGDYTIEKTEKKIKSKLIKNLIPSVLGNKNIPEYIERHFIEKTSNPVALNDNQWKKILVVACSIYNKSNHLYDVYDENKKDEDYIMLNEENNSRDYFYGPFVSSKYIDYVEEKSLMIQQKSRDINLENKVKDQATEKKKDDYVKQVCKDWVDVCAFGQVIA
jgi:CRISPR-associated protein Csd1